MKLKNLQITNFRCFESLSMDLDKQLTVLVAKNGQGKSSVLDAIRIGLWSFVSGFDVARNPANEIGSNISIDDVRNLKIRIGQMERQLPCKITLNGYETSWVEYEQYGVLPKTYIWTRSRTSVSPEFKTEDDAYVDYVRWAASDLQEKVRSNEETNIALPIIRYYDTERILRKTEIVNNVEEYDDKEFFSQLFAYEDCLNPSSSYKNFSKWFIWIFNCYKDEQFSLMEKGFLKFNRPSKWKETILVIQQAINDVLQAETGWRDLEYSVSDEKSLILNHPDYGKLKVEQLSDGIRGILAMVGDIAYRCVKLNWHLGVNAAKETHGVVMIDEIEMHLHPAWQQSILSNLCKAFPNIQFIVTTHSPQVLSTVPSHQIRVLDNGKVCSGGAGTQGAEASRILKQVFGVDSRPKNDPNTQLLNEYLDLVYKDKWDEAKEQRAKLDEIYQGYEPALTAADLYIENRQWELE